MARAMPPISQGLGWLSPVCGTSVEGVVGIFSFSAVTSTVSVSVVVVVFYESAELVNYNCQLVRFFQQFFRLVHHIRITEGVFQSGSQRGQIFVFIILVNIPVQILQRLHYPVLLKGPRPVKHGLAGVPAIIQQLPDPLCSLLPCNSGGSEALCALAGCNLQTRLIIP